ncbi:hypothetical protein EVA_07149 [gut metagenome]|uniref:Uncharacterized protein n=1 Tax=gut metagenome TaxID=749906 RepID=J9GQI8_9ZZZZ
MTLITAPSVSKGRLPRRVSKSCTSSMASSILFTTL